MTVNEFKAWFEGFSEGISVAPNILQWDKIKEKVDQLGAPVMRSTPDMVAPYQPNVHPSRNNISWNDLSGRLVTVQGDPQ